MQKVYLPSSFTKCNENCGLPDFLTDYQIRSVLPRFSKGQGAIRKGHFSPVNGPSKGHFSAVNGQSKGNFSAVN